MQPRAPSQSPAGSPSPSAAWSSSNGRSGRTGRTGGSGGASGSGTAGGSAAGAAAAPRSNTPAVVEFDMKFTCATCGMQVDIAGDVRRGCTCTVEWLGEVTKKCCQCEHHRLLLHPEVKSVRIATSR